MAARITHNPRLETIPNHAGPHYNALRNILVNTGLSAKEAIQSLNDTWTRAHDERVQLWDQQVDFSETSTVDNFLTPRPSEYALRRLENLEYVELWYLTREGLKDAAQHQQASKNVVQDIDLTWDQLSIAKMMLIRQVTKYRWPEKTISALTQFFMNLEMHQYHQQQPYGEQALLIYQARVRRDWHDQLKQGSGFNIAIINETLLRSFHREVMDKAYEDSLSKLWNLVNNSPNSRDDQTRTHRRRGRRNQNQHRQFNSSGRPRQQSRSQSPIRRNVYNASGPSR